VVLTATLCEIFAGCATGERPKVPTTVESPPPPGPVTRKSHPGDPEQLPFSSANPIALTALREGLDLLENARVDDARQQFKVAAELDPGFASAIALWGSTIPGPEGAKKIDDAVAMAASLPPAERTHILYRQALHAKEHPRAADLAKKLVDLAPKNARAHLLLGSSLRDIQRTADAEAEYTTALTLNPDLAQAWNNLAYLEFDQGKLAEAIAHFRRYAELRPKEPNPQDSLGEALMGAGKLEEAEAAFTRALTIDYKFYESWEGVAFARLYRGDWKGGYEALDRMRERSQTQQGRLDTDRDLAWVLLADGRGADALKTIDNFELAATRTGDAANALVALYDRAWIANELGKGPLALKSLQTLYDRVAKDKSAASDGGRFQLVADARALECSIDARLGKPADAEKALDALTAAVGTSAESDIAGRVAYARGEVQLARGDAAGAAKTMKGCLATDDWCAFARADAEERAGDRATAAADRERLAKLFHRDPVYFYVWRRLTGPSGAR